MRNYRMILAAVALLVAASSCSDKATVNGSLAGAPDSKVVFKRLSGGSFNVLDTVKTDASGAYSYKMKIAQGQPEFVYVFHDDTRVASLILQSGENVKVVSDLTGKYTVEGSVESEKLKTVEDDFSAFMKDFTAAVNAEDGPAASRKYVEYYRSRIKYIMDNCKSLSSIPVLYQKINDNFPVFGQSTDAVHFRSVHDSLALVYPESKYVISLGKEVDRRFNALAIEQKISTASEAGYPDLEMSAVDGKKVKISDLDSKLVMVYFWQASDAANKMFNQDVLIPLYKTYHPKGLEIYAISLDTDKGVWASAVKSQELPWINVCDGLGAASPSVYLYNLSKGFPVAYIIENGTMDPKVYTSSDELKKAIASKLK